MAMTNREPWLDALRGVAILIVILGHALQGACGGGCSTGLHQFILSFQMEFFFAISGFSAAYSNPPTFIAALKKKLLRLGVPYLSWVWLFYIAEAILGIKAWAVRDAFGCVIFSGFWFLRQLLLINVAFEIFRFGTRKWNITTGILLGLCASGAMLLTPGQDKLASYALFFVLGYILKISCSQARIETPPKFSDIVPPPLLIWCGKNSLALYAVHWNIFFVFLSLQLVNFSIISATMGIYAVALFLFVIYLSGSVLIIGLMRKIPFLPQIFLGDKLVSNHLLQNTTQ